MWLDAQSILKENECVCLITRYKECPFKILPYSDVLIMAINGTSFY